MGSGNEIVTNPAKRVTPKSAAAQIIARSKRFSSSDKNKSLTSTIVLSNSSIALDHGKTTMRRRVTNVVTSKMLLLN